MVSQYYVHLRFTIVGASFAGPDGNYLLDGDHMDKLPNRKNIRLKDYNYAQSGYYFITICTKDKKNLCWNLGASFAGAHKELPLSSIGKIIDLEINKINTIYETAVEINNYVVMPNHIHMIIIIYNRDGNDSQVPKIQRIIQQFKGSITKQVGFPLCQKSFYDHIIRSQIEYEKINEYIETNPLKWEEDKYYLKMGQQSYPLP